MTSKDLNHKKKSLNRRSVDDEPSRHAQMWWSFVVGIFLAAAALLQMSKPRTFIDPGHTRTVAAEIQGGALTTDRSQVE